MTKLVLAVLLLGSSAFAHGGGTDKHGCHRDRKRGGYHCHNGGPAQAPVVVRPPAPVKPEIKGVK